MAAEVGESRGKARGVCAVVVLLQRGRGRSRPCHGLRINAQVGGGWACDGGVCIREHDYARQEDVKKCGGRLGRSRVVAEESGGAGRTRGTVLLRAYVHQWQGSEDGYGGKRPLVPRRSHRSEERR